MFKKITNLYGCNGIKGLVSNPEDRLIISKHSFFVKLGKFLENRKKLKRTEIINISTKPTITIILPVFNSEKTITKAIESIQNQSYFHWELLVINDGSTDRTLSVIKSISKNDNRIKIYQNAENMGVAYSRNIGLYYAMSDFITFQDADDYSHHERLEYQLTSILFEPKYKVVVPQYVRVNTKGKIYLINGKIKWNRVSGMLFPRELIKELGYFKLINISEDSEYYERILALYGIRSRKVLCKVLYFALFSPDSLLFSNASFNIESDSINYRINDEDYIELCELRENHKLIKKGVLSPYQSFQVDMKVTKLCKLE